MIEIQRTSSANTDFKTLVAQLDKELALRNGASNDFFAQYNTIDQIKHVIIARLNNRAVGCGAMKAYDEQSMEIKRMFVLTEMRGRGIAVEILNNLETWAKDLNYCKCILETGDKMPEAIALYTKCDYCKTPNYGQYVHSPTSVCFMKQL